MTPEKRPLGILEMGLPTPAVRKRFGDFVDWIRACLPVGIARTSRVVALTDRAFPAPEELSGVIITGSPSMVNDATAREKRAFGWTEKVIGAKVPVLGLCYGHQMLGHIFGGEVGPLPGGPEIGLTNVMFSAGGDRLFGPCGKRRRVAVLHWQSILRLPMGARVFGRNAREPHHAVRFAQGVWGVQFHPEFGADAVAAYLDRHALLLREHRRDAGREGRETLRWRDRTGVVARFASLAAEGNHKEEG